MEPVAIDSPGPDIEIHDGLPGLQNGRREFAADGGDRLRRAAYANLDPLHSARRSRGGPKDGRKSGRGWVAEFVHSSPGTRNHPERRTRPFDALEQWRPRGVRDAYELQLVARDGTDERQWAPAPGCDMAGSPIYPSGARACRTAIRRIRIGRAAASGFFELIRRGTSNGSTGPGLRGGTDPGALPPNRGACGAGRGRRWWRRPFVPSAQCCHVILWIGDCDQDKGCRETGLIPDRFDMKRKDAFFYGSD